MSKVETKEVAATTKVVVLKPEVTLLAEKITQCTALDDKSGINLVTEKILTPEVLSGYDLTEADLDNHRRLMGDVVSASLLSHGQKSIAAMTSNKALDKTTLEMPISGKDTVSVQFQREREVRDVSSGDVSTKFGVSSVAFNMYGAGSRGEVKKVKTLLSDKAFDAFGS